ncbi:MAG: NTP transferase domain-containing protein [Oscillospiraceae bacterium]|nr:NTP transferase domain-containing protein [Oscillospiraceae bacterium]
MSASFVIMAAGLGSRYGGIKQMEGVGPHGEILLEYAVYDALRAGFDRIVAVLRPDIVDDFRERVGRKLEKHTPLCYAVQDFSSLPDFYRLPDDRSRPFGTVHALLCAAPCLDGPFAVLNADDYYGRNAIASLRGALDGLQNSGEGCMVAYRMKNTVSPYGSVSRGVCRLEGEQLCEIEELRGIAPSENGRILAGEREIPGDAPVSMNLWGFGRGVLEDMEAYFRSFLHALPPDDVSAECLLPVYVGDRLRQGTLRVRALESTDRWFGMTYREDRTAAVRSLRSLIEQGVYPSVLY